jgi:hypothetical protein
VEAVEAGVRIYVSGRVNRTIAALVKYLPHPLIEAAGRRAGRAYRKT